MQYNKLAMTLCAGLMTATTALAEYPEKPVNFVVPFPPGDLEDILTRMIAEDFGDEYGVPAAVVNKPGGGGGPFPGAVDVALAPADGYTVGSFVLDVSLIGPHIGIEPLNPNPFEPIGIFVTYPFVIAAGGDAPYNTMEELAEYAKSNDVALAHFGAELTPTQVTFAMAKEMGFEYASEAAFDAIDCNTFASGDADVGNTTLQLILPCLDQVKVLASMTSDRIPLTPDAPTIGEIVPDLAMITANGLFVHKDTPQDVRDKIIAVAEKTMMSERAQDLAKQTGAEVYWMNAEESQALLDTNTEIMGRISEILE